MKFFARSTAVVLLATVLCSPAYTQVAAQPAPARFAGPHMQALQRLDYVTI